MVTGAAGRNGSPEMVTGSGEKTIAVLQSNYIPWKGYFDIIAAVDEFHIYHCCQYTQYDWRNRNRIKTRKGTQWLTIPVQRKGHLNRRIDEVRVSNQQWREKHWKGLSQNYAPAPHFADYKDILEDFYRGTSEVSLSKINVALIRILCKLLGITTVIEVVEELPDGPDPTARLISLCRRLHADRHLFGPAAGRYLDIDSFRTHGLSDLWFDYSGYPEYRQLYPPFEHQVTILDLLFNEGSRAPQFLRR
jgi:hypothetical protein